MYDNYEMIDNLSFQYPMMCPMMYGAGYRSDDPDEERKMKQPIQQPMPPKQQPMQQPMPPKKQPVPQYVPQVKPQYVPPKPAPQIMPQAVQEMKIQPKIESANVQLNIQPKMEPQNMELDIQPKNESIKMELDIQPKIQPKMETNNMELNIAPKMGAMIVEPIKLELNIQPKMEPTTMQLNIKPVLQPVEQPLMIQQQQPQYIMQYPQMMPCPMANHPSCPMMMHKMHIHAMQINQHMMTKPLPGCKKIKHCGHETKNLNDMWQQSMKHCHRNPYGDQYFEEREDLYL